MDWESNMKIPSHTTILGKKLKVLFKSQKYISQKIGLNAQGYLDWHKKTIYILDELPQDEAFITYVHEVVHASHFITGLNQIIDPATQEILCEVTANMVCDLIRK